MQDSRPHRSKNGGGRIKTKEDLISYIKSGNTIRCDKEEQRREVLLFLKEDGEVLSGCADRCLMFGMSYPFKEFPHVGFMSDRKCFTIFTDIYLEIAPHIGFDEIAPILRGEHWQDYEIDGDVFDAMFPP